MFKFEHGFELSKIDHLCGLLVDGRRRTGTTLFVGLCFFNQNLRLTHRKQSRTILWYTVTMPPRKKTVQVDDTGDEARVQTRSTNVNKHPGAEAQAVLRVSKPRRPPEVIQEEKDQKKAKKEAKAKEMLEEKVRLEALEQELEEYRAQQEVEIEKEGAMIPRHQSRST